MAVTTKPPHTTFLTSIPIDMSTLSHSELHLLSLLSSPSTTTTTTTTTTATQFSINPSLSTHQQTYSLSPHHPRHRHLLNQEQRSESNLILSFLRKNLRRSNHRPKKGKALSVDIVNREGVVVDLAALEESELVGGGPFASELNKRANGRVKEEELLEMLAGIDGDWCSRRRKRRVIDASLLGDALPLGWKVIVALRRKGGNFTPYCRTYISPTGEQFLSCKEVSSYLKSYFGINDAKVVRDARDESQQLRIIDPVDIMCTDSNDGTSMLELPNSTMLNSTCVPTVQQEASILGIDDLADVPVCDLYECHSCNITFDEKDKYLKHVFLLHQKTTRRYTLDNSMDDKVIIANGEPQPPKGKKRRKSGSSVGDGVIMIDGKYGCQFCDKVFEERRRYLGHVGNHVKGSIKSTKDSHVDMINPIKSPSLDKSHSNISKMDALIEIAQNSIQEYNMPITRKEPASVSKVDQLIVAENRHGIDVDMGTENTSSSHLNGVNNGNCLREDVRVHPSCDKVTEISVTDKHVDYTDDPPGDYEGEDTIGGKSFSLQLNAVGRMGQILSFDEDSNGLLSCPKERELEKFVSKERTSPRELNPLVMLSARSTFDGEIDTATCSIVNFEKDCSSEATMVRTVENGVAENISVRCKSITAGGEEYSDEPVEAFNVDHLQFNGRASDLDFSSDNNQSEYVHKQGPESTHKYDGNELVTFSKNHASDCAVSQISLNSSSPFDDIFEKAGQNICNLDQNLDSVTSLEYMKLDVIEPEMYKYSGMSREDSISFYEVSMDMGNNNIGLGLGLDNSLRSQQEFPQEMTANCLTTNVCVWCGVEFSHEIGEVELQPDSVGFMCQTCRAKISKQFNELESNFPEFSLF